MCVSCYVYYNILQHTAPLCNTLQHAATHSFIRYSCYVYYPRFVLCRFPCVCVCVCVRVRVIHITRVSNNRGTCITTVLCVFSCHVYFLFLCVLPQNLSLHTPRSRTHTYTHTHKNRITVLYCNTLQQYAYMHINV